MPVAQSVLIGDAPLRISAFASNGLLDPPLLPLHFRSLWALPDLPLGIVRGGEARPLDLPFGVVAELVCPLPPHLSPYSQEY